VPEAEIPHVELAKQDTLK